MKKICMLLTILLLSVSLISCKKKDKFWINDIVVIYNESKEIVIIFNEDEVLKVDYSYQGDSIRIKGNVVYGLYFDTETIVTARSGKYSTTFKVKVILAPGDGYYDYASYSIDEDEIGIGKYIGKKVSGELRIPTYILGKKVVAIGDDSFANNQEKLRDVTTIIIPKYVRSIGRNAFYNNINIKNIIFEKDSELMEINKLSFSKIPNLTTFTIPSKLDHIPEDAFKGSGITDFIIINNKYFEWKNNFLIDKDTSRENAYIAIYANPTISDFVVPEHVIILNAYLFENNKVIKTIDFNELEHVGYQAFVNSSLEEIIGGEFLKHCEDADFLNTPWLNKKLSEGK